MENRHVIMGLVVHAITEHSGGQAGLTVGSRPVWSV